MHYALCIKKCVKRTQTKRSAVQRSTAPYIYVKAEIRARQGAASAHTIVCKRATTPYCDVYTSLLTYFA